MRCSFFADVDVSQKTSLADGIGPRAGSAFMHEWPYREMGPDDHGKMADALRFDRRRPVGLCFGYGQIQNEL